MDSSQDPAVDSTNIWTTYSFHFWGSWLPSRFKGDMLFCDICVCHKNC